MKYFEQRLDEENLKSKRIAWTAFGAMTLVSIALAIAVMIMMPLKQTAVKLLVVDKNTGLPSEITALGNIASGDLRQITGAEALSKYFANQYIIARDSYNYYSVRGQFEAVQLYSTPEVFDDYYRRFFGENSIEKQLGRNRVMEVNVVSITPQNIPTRFKDREDGGITVQARVEKQIREGDQVLSRNSGVVTMTFGFDDDLHMDEKARNMNPFGFTVTSYRFDADMGGS